MNRPLTALITLVLITLACGNTTPEPAGAPPETEIQRTATSIFDSTRTQYGFFPSPSEFNEESVLSHFQDLGNHADFILLQPNVPWADFVNGPEGESQAKTDIKNQIILADMNGLGVIFVVDPLNGLNRREFHNLPPGWNPTFDNPDVRKAYKQFVYWIVEEFEPTYLGLASEINTYMDAHPQDVEHFHSLFQEVYQEVKDRAPETQIFVTFQWDDLNNMFATASEGRSAYDANWEQIQRFEPELDLWVISSYPYFVYENGKDIPGDYYARLRDKTDKPLGVAEGGFTSLRGEGDQSAYLRAIHDQLGDRMTFWVYLILSDLNMENLSSVMKEQGVSEDDIQALSHFANIGLQKSNGDAKPALDVWEAYRQEK